MNDVLPKLNKFEKVLCFLFLSVLAVLIIEGLILFLKSKIITSDKNLLQNKSLTPSSVSRKIIEKPPVYEIPNGNIVQVEIMGRLQDFEGDYWVVSSEDGRITVQVRIDKSREFLLLDRDIRLHSVSYDELKRLVSKGDKIAVNNVSKETDQRYVSLGAVLIDKKGTIINY